MKPTKKTPTSTAVDEEKAESHSAKSVVGKGGKRQGITEAEFLRQVIELAQLRGFRVAHFRPARTAHGWRTAVAGDGKGFPDLVLVRDDRLIFAELKAGRGKCTEEQDAWLRALAAVAWGPDMPAGRIRVCEWHADSDSDWAQIERVLR